jgi:hypothetical protein
METVYAADKNVTRCFLGTPMTVPWVVRMPRMSYHGLDEATTYTFYGWTPAGISENSADASDHRTEHSRFSRYFAQRRVLYFHDCARRRSRRQECYEFRCFGNPMTVPWIVRTPQCLYYGLDEATTYILWLDNKFRRNQRKLGGRQDHRTEYSDSPIFLRCVLYFHDRTWRRSTPPIRMLRVSTFWEPDGAMDSRMPRMPILLVNAANIYFLWLDNKPAGDSAVSTGRVQRRSRLLNLYISTTDHRRHRWVYTKC